MYKKSNYNIEVDTLENNSILLFNTMSSSFGILDLETKKVYDNIESINDQEDINSLMENKEFINMLNNGYIVPHDFNELDLLKLRRESGKYLNKSLTLTIAPTLDCNMACPYCYEKRQKNRMEEHIREVTYDFVESYLEKNGCKTFHTTWYGGEPLLELDIIYEMSERFIKICDNKKVKYTASIVTNGVLLEKDVAKKLREDCNVLRAQITIDGLPEYHNKRRILIDGRDSFGIIVENIENCKNLMDITVRVNVDKNNIENIEQLTDYLIKEKGWIDSPSIGLAPVEIYSENCKCNHEDCLNANEFAELDNRLTNILYNANSKDLKARLYPLSRGTYCGAVQRGVYVVDPEGDLYTCWNVVGEKDKKIGNIIQKEPMNVEYIKWLTHEPSGKCLDCNILPICCGGCPYETFKNNYPKCDKRMQNYKEKLKIAYKDYIGKKMYC